MGGTRNNIHIGTSGWSYPHWKGTFYPQHLPAGRMLEYYAQQFRSVEINSTFYHLPERQRLREWYAGTPDDFLFSVKASRYITHMKKLGDPRDTATRMGTLARQVEARATWDDLILPEAQKRTLEQIAVHARHRMKVHHDWGFAEKGGRGLGIASLFSGESGTGKTLAAEVLANTLGLVLYRIDLSAVISKYIGETEKNLRTVFDAAEDVGAILLFDEADALFGKRSEVKDSHDRYANIEVSYLLQRMEAYRGLAILTTNHKAALDTAFSRRLRFVVHFPYPDARQREAIWRSAFPAGTPLQDLDYTKLARLNATGGNIRNIALAAAFLAAEAGTPVGMGQLLRAAHVEAAKREKAPSDAETRGWT